MDQSANGSEIERDGRVGKLQDISLGVVVGWVWAAFFAVLGITMVSLGDEGAGACTLLSALVALPPINAYVQSSWRFPFSGWLQSVCAVALMIAAAWLLGLTSLNFPTGATGNPESQSASTRSPDSTAPQSTTNRADQSPPNSESADTSGNRGNPTSTTPATGDETQAQPPPVSHASDSAAIAAAMQNRFGNTVISQSSMAEWHFYFNGDGSFSGLEVRSNYRVQGTWQASESSLCLTYQPPLPGVSNPDCKPVTEHQVGDQWALGGSQFALVQGIR